MNDVALSITRPPGRGWVQLPVQTPKRGGLARKILGASKDSALHEWAATQARETLGSHSDPDVVAAHAQTLTNLTLGCRERGETMAFVWFPEPGAGPLAQMSVSTYGRSGGQPKLALDQLEEEFGWRDGQTGRLESARIDLPGGPAVRVRREQAIGDSVIGDSVIGDAAGRAGPSDVVVSITYALLPPGMNDALIFTMYWSLPDDEPLLTEIADSTAGSLRFATG